MLITLLLLIIAFLIYRGMKLVDEINELEGREINSMRYGIQKAMGVESTHKYEIIKTEGCTAYDLTFNGKSENDLTDEEKDEIIDHLLYQAKLGISDGSIMLTELVGIFQSSDYDYDDRPCGQCGDTVSTTTYHI